MEIVRYREGKEQTSVRGVEEEAQDGMLKRAEKARGVGE